MLLWSLPVLRHLAIWTHKVRFEAGVNQLNLEKVKGALLASPGWGEIPTGPFQGDKFWDTGIFPPHTSLQPFYTLLNTDSSTFFFFPFYFFPHLLYLKISCLPGSKTIDTLWSLHQSLFLAWSLHITLLGPGLKPWKPDKRHSVYPHLLITNRTKQHTWLQTLSSFVLASRALWEAREMISPRSVSLHNHF